MRKVWIVNVVIIGINLSSCLDNSFAKGIDFAFKLAGDGKASSVIVLPDKANKTRIILAQDLQHWLREITGVDIPIEAPPSKERTIYLGISSEYPGQAAKEKINELGPEGFIVKSSRTGLWLLANTELGLQNAVYGFLEEVGCRWFFPNPVWTVIPKKETLAIRVSLREKPAFDSRIYFYGDGGGKASPALYDHWCKYNRLMGHFQIDTAHASCGVSPGYFKEHPEWFALIGGKRQPSQVCLSNPQAQQKAVENVLGQFRNNPDRNMVSVDPNDNFEHCECEKCAAMGPLSDRVFNWANVVARAVQKEFPGKWVGLHAYLGYCEPPGFPLEHNVFVNATTNLRFPKRVLDLDDQVKAFKKLGARVGLYDYWSLYTWRGDIPGGGWNNPFLPGGPGNVYQTNGPANVYRVAEFIRHAGRDLGVSEYLAQISVSWGNSGLGYWVCAKMLWDPDRDPKWLVREFCEHAFGKAADPMQRFYERMANRPDPHSWLKLSFLDLKEAYRLELDPGVCARLDHMVMYLHWWLLTTDYNYAVQMKEWDQLVKPPEERAHKLVVFTGRLMDTGLINSHLMFAQGWFSESIAELKNIQGFDMTKVEAWKHESTDIPSSREVARILADDLKSTSSNK